MKIVQPSYKILNRSQLNGALFRIEQAARTCYKSEEKSTGTFEGAKAFVQKLIKRKHYAMIEFGGIMTVKFVTDRGVSHEMVRHRLCSFGQESTRFCDYGKEGEIQVVLPPSLMPRTPEYIVWQLAVERCEASYNAMRGEGVSPQIARSVLPTCLKTELVWMANLREWMHIFNQRTSAAAHPQMRELMVPLLEEVRTLVPVVFDDLEGA